jgi:DNA-binding response OmpR family regulator
MPVMDGYEATKIIRESAPGTSHPAIIAVTASVFEEKQAEVTAIGCDDIVIKPFKERDIIEMLQKYLFIKFLHTNGENLTERTSRKNDKLDVSPADFKTLPEALVTKFKASVATLEMDSCLNIIEEIKEQNQSLAAALKLLVEEYRFDKLQQLLDESEKS